MAKRKSTDIKRVGLGNALPPVPAHMADEGEIGTEELKRYVVPPRVKIIQKQVLDPELADLFGTGDVVLVPDKTLVCEMKRDDKGKPTGVTSGFTFVPLFFFVEYCAWNPMSMRGKAPPIRERSFDPTSELARKATAPALREEPHPDDPKAMIRNVEHLNFLIAIQGLPPTDAPPIMTFARGSYMRGSAFCSLIRARNAPLFGCVFDAHQIQEHNELGDWWSLVVTNPSGTASPWVTDKSQYKTYEALYEEMRKAYSNANIRADYESADEPPAKNTETAAY